MIRRYIEKIAKDVFVSAVINFNRVIRDSFNGFEVRMNKQFRLHYDDLLAVAMAAKIKPEVLAKFYFDKVGVGVYSGKVTNELIKLLEKSRKNNQVVKNNTKTKKKVVAKKKSK